jgi:general secretion pathway protein K
MRSREQGGFVLVLVLAMLVVLGLLAGTIAAVTGRLAEQAQQRAQATRDAVDIASTRATVLYLLSTQRMTVGGLTVDNLVSFGEGGIRPIESGADLDSSLPIGTEIALDSRAYQGIGGVRFAIQDDYGLFGVNWHPHWRLERLLAQGGQARPVPAEALINRLFDYQDRDGLYRLNSMEADGYRKEGMRLPTNLPLATPMEVVQVSGWRQALSFLTPAEITETITVEPAVMINVNTAPARVLRVIEGVTGEKATRAIMFRKLQPFMTDAAFFEFLGLPKAPEASVAVYPATSGTLKLWPSHGGQVGLVHWMMTPIDEKGGRPWREDYELIQSQAPSQDAVAYPVRSRLFGQQVAPRK